MSWITITLEVTTPLFNGGHDLEWSTRAGRDRPRSHDSHDDATGVRVPSLLGAMRFWFRALAGIHVGGDLDALRYWEARVFGRAASEGSGPPAPSPLQWRIPRRPPVVREDESPGDWLPSWKWKERRTRGQGRREPDDDRWLLYLAGQGLADLGSCTLRRPHVPPGKCFDLQVRLRRDDAQALALALASLWLTCAYGGVGARTRRGFGGLRIVGTDPGGVGLPAPWDRVPLAEPTAEDHPVHPVTWLWPERLPSWLEWFRAPANTPDPQFSRFSKERLVHRWEEIPPYPTLGRARLSGRETVRAGLGSERFETWHSALRAAGERWRLFRADEDAPRAGYSPKRKSTEWTTVIHGQEDRYAVGSLGLPVIYKDGWSVKVFSEDGQELRRASPVWIRPVLIEGRWRILSFTFLNRFLPEDRGVEVRVVHDATRKKAVTVPQEEILDLTRLWLERIEARPAGGSGSVAGS